jgi:hypothetical protein
VPVILLALFVGFLSSMFVGMTAGHDGRYHTCLSFLG